MTRVVLCCPDKFRGSLTAAEAAAAMVSGVERNALAGRALPLADGGEGTLDALLASGGERHTTRVTGPLGDLVDADWGLLPDGTAVVEMAQASGLALVTGRKSPLDATTYGTGELIAAALEHGARRVIVGVGGSATVDGGLGALEALDFDLRGADVLVACDVTTGFVDCAAVYGPQKGATPSDVEYLERRLAELTDRYRDRFDVDVSTLAGAGAAGGLAGGLAAAGAALVPGAGLVASVAGLDAALHGAALVLTGEGRLDATSFAGKVVGHVLERAAAAGVRAGVIVGSVADDVPNSVEAAALVARAGSLELALADARRLVVEAAAELSGGMVTAEPRQQARHRTCGDHRR